METYLAEETENIDEIKDPFDVLNTDLGRRWVRRLNNLYDKIAAFSANKSLLFIITSLVVITLIIFVLRFFPIGKDLQEMGYLLYGIPIIFATLNYGKASAGLKIVVIANPIWYIAVINRFNSKIHDGDYGELLLETIGIPLTYYIGCVVFGKLVWRERKLLREYKELVAQLVSQNKLLKKYHNDLVKTLTNAIDAKDAYTRGHSERVGCYALAVAKRMGLSAQEQRDIFYAGALHDIGKIGVKEKILQKPSSLSAAEYSEVKAHAAIGLDILADFESMDTVKKLIYCHHERCDGSGYPRGLTGADIPLGSKIIAVVDSFDAQVSNRTYQKEATEKEALAELKNCAGKLFDTEVVEIFGQLLEDGTIKLDFKDCLDKIS